MAVFPVAGYKGPVNLHWGLATGGTDIFGGRGASILAVDSGTVESAGYSSIGGYNVQIRHANGLESYYAHLQAPPLVKAGQQVNAGTPIGLLGDTGNAAGTGAHLHFGMGYGIISGSGPSGGTGRNFNAVDFLRNLLGLGVRPEDEQQPRPPASPGTTPGGKDVGPDQPTTPAPGTTTPDGKDTGPAPGAEVDTYSGQIIKIDTKPVQVGPWTVELPSGISLVPEAVQAAEGFARYRVIPIVIGLIITVLGGQLVARGDSGSRILGIEVVIVGLSIVWFGYRNTTNIAWGAIRP